MFKKKKKVDKRNFVDKYFFLFRCHMRQRKMSIPSNFGVKIKRTILAYFEYIFSIMASSVLSESLFSEAGDQVTNKRNRLDPEKVNKMMVISEFYSER